MKSKLTIFLLTLASILAPVELSVICLFGTMGVDTIVKLISLKFIAKREGRPYREVFLSKMLRRGYMFKLAGYAFVAIPLFPLDYYLLTPFVKNLLSVTGYEIVLNKALFTNGILIIFSLIEISSINENWFDITGNNMLKAVFTVVKKIRRTIEGAAETYRNIKK
jgi:hypothetical protein